MKSIAIFQADLNVGGIQRSLVNLLKSGVLNDFNVDVYLFSKKVFYDMGDLPNNIKMNYLNPFPYWYRFIPFGVIRKFHKKDKTFKEYDIVIDYDGYRQECAFYVTSIERARKIMWIHSDMFCEYRFNLKYRILYLFFRDKYQYYDEFVAVSEGVAEPFRKMSRRYDSKVTVVPNIINAEEILKKSTDSSDIIVDSGKMNIVCVGRLYLVKGYDFLLKDFWKAYKIRRDLRLYIIGDGPDRKKYQKWVNANGLADVVFFLGKKENPFTVMNQMDAFCLESRYEGQGMVLMEAKTLGLQLIFPERLEKYNIGLKGTPDIVKAMANLQKQDKKTDLLEEYHAYLFAQLKVVFNGR